MPQPRKTGPKVPPHAPERDGRDSRWAIPDGGFDTYRSAAVHLRRPFTPKALKWKPQRFFGPDSNPSGAQIVGYIDARLVIERLNLLVPGLWSATYDPVADGRKMWCHLTVDGITRADLGEGSSFGKALVSDALKRAAVHFGVGISVYALPEIKWWMKDRGNCFEKQGKSFVISGEGRKGLRESYEAWLVQAEANFGPALDHGDVGNPVGDPDETDQSPGHSAPTQPNLDELSEQARMLYAQVCSLTPQGSGVDLLPAEFTARADAARADEKAMGEFLKFLTEKLEQAKMWVAA